MGYGSAGITKLQYGSFLAAALAYLMNRQRDAVGLIAFDDEIMEMLPASARAGHLTSLLVTLERLKLGEQTNVAKPLRDLAEAIRKRGLVVLISDLLDEPGRVHRRAEALPLSRHRSDRVSGARSGGADVSRSSRPRASATSRRQTKSSRCRARSASSISQAVADLQERYRRELRLAGIDYVLLDTSVPLETALMVVPADAPPVVLTCSGAAAMFGLSFLYPLFLIGAARGGDSDRAAPAPAPDREGRGLSRGAPAAQGAGGAAAPAAAARADPAGACASPRSLLLALAFARPYFDPAAGRAAARRRRWSRSIRR